MTDFEQSQELADQQLQQRLAAERERDDLIHVMESPQGRRVIWKVLESAGVFSVTFTGDNNYTNFNEGRRNEGLRLFTDVMKHCPDLYLTMAKEAREEPDK